MLVINSASSENAVRFEWGTDYEYLNSDINFRYEENTQSYYSCSFTFNNEMFIVGGLNIKKQVSMVSDCGLSQTDIFLPMAFDHGQCTTVGSGQVFMCFPYDAENDCWSFDNKEFMKQPNSIHPHYLGGLSEWNNSVVAIAGQQGVTTEILSLGWNELEPLPDTDYLMYLSAVVLYKKIYVFGE